MIIREAEIGDLGSLLGLYAQFKSVPAAEADARVAEIWHEILSDKNHHILIAELGEQIVSSCVLLIAPNLTRSGRPYAVIENVITDEAHRNNGYGSAVLKYARELAVEAGCYKMMLMTGSNLPSTLKFYERAGFNRNDKTAFIQWL